MKRVLIFNDHSFAGQSLLEALLSTALYEITVLSEEKKEWPAPKGPTYVKGSRQSKANQQLLAGQSWDFVIDLSTQYPAEMESTLKHLSDPGLYVYMSSCAVYPPRRSSSPLRKENSETFRKSATPSATPQSFGERQAECERLLAGSGLDHLILRPATLYGPGDTSDLLYYWIYHIREGGLLTIPDQGERFFSLTHVKDVSRTILAGMAQKPPASVYNVVSTALFNIRGIIDAVSPILNRHCVMFNAPSAFLHAHGLQQWTDLPLWVDGDHHTFNGNRWQRDFNLKPTDFREGLLETLSYYADLKWPVPKSGLSAEKRDELLRELRQFTV